MRGVIRMTLMDVTLVIILTLSSISRSTGSRPASFPGAVLAHEGEFTVKLDEERGQQIMVLWMSGLLLNLEVISTSTCGLNENVNKLLKFVESSVKTTFNFALLITKYIYMAQWQMWRAKRTTNLEEGVQTVFKCFINQLNPELELLILPGTSADQSSWLNEKFTIVLLVQ